MSTEIYNAIVKRFVDNNVDDLLKNNNSYLSIDDFKTLKKIVKQVMIEEEKIEQYIDTYYFLSKKKEIFYIITEQLQGAEVNDAKGFAIFRMKYFENILEDILDNIVEKYMIEKEYIEFIRLLKYFVEIQTSKIDTLVIKFADNGYLLEDIEGNDIKDEIEKDFEDIPVSCDDKLISALITSAPEYIIIQNVDKCKNKELMEIVKEVFKNKLKIE